MTCTKKKILLCIALAITVFWVGFIFSNSLDNGEESGEKSSAVTEIVNSIAQSVGIDEPIQESTVRNMGHFLEFAVLSLLVCADIALISYALKAQKPTVTRLMAAAPVCCLVACIDELIQKFSAGRAAQFSDVLTDTLGAICAMAIFICFYIACCKINWVKNAKNTR